jgi:hypothetical protein
MISAMRIISHQICEIRLLNTYFARHVLFAVIYHSSRGLCCWRTSYNRALTDASMREFGRRHTALRALNVLACLRLTAPCVTALAVEAGGATLEARDGAGHWGHLGVVNVSQMGLVGLHQSATQTLTNPRALVSDGTFHQ